MNKQEFIEKIILDVRNAALEDVILKLNRPPGRRPRQRHILQSKWYSQLSHENKSMLQQVLLEAIDEALFGIFAVLDGVRSIQEPESKGQLELSYNDGGSRQLLNDTKSNSLHDIYNLG